MTPAARNRVALITTGALLLALAGLWLQWFLDNYERRERTVRGGVSAEARRNPYLAAERYLERLDYSVDTVRGRGRLKQLPVDTGVLVVHDAGPSLPPDDESRLLAWVERGGHLVLVPRRVQDPDEARVSNRLFERFGVRLRRERIEEGNGPADGTPPAAQRDIVVVEAGDAAGRGYEVAFDPELSLEDSDPVAQQRLSGDHGVHLLAWERGAGRVTVLSDNDFMLNEHIGDHDHAWFVSHLMRRNDRVWLLVDAAMAPLPAILWRRAPEATLAAMLLGLLWLWRSAATHGPRVRSQPRVRRNIIEHLEAVAAYAWRRDREGALTQQSRTAVEKQWRRRHPQLDRMEESARCEWIAGRTGMAESDIRSALYAAPKDEAGLIRSTIVQQRLHRFLSYNEHPIEE